MSTETKIVVCPACGNEEEIIKSVVQMLAILNRDLKCRHCKEQFPLKDYTIKP